MILIQPRRSILRTLKAGDVVAFHNDKGRQVCQNNLATIASNIGGKFQQRSAQLIVDNSIYDITLVHCLDPVPPTWQPMKDAAALRWLEKQFNDAPEGSPLKNAIQTLIDLANPETAETACTEST